MNLTTQGIVLRSAQYGEHDRMLTLLTPEYGRVDAIARGSRKSKSAFPGAVELFCAGEYQLYGNHDKFSVQQCRIQENFYDLRFDVDRLISATYCTSLCEAAVPPMAECRALFMLLLTALAHLELADLPLPLCVSGFEMRMMPLLGYTPYMDRCLVCGAEFDGGGRFDARLGGVVCPNCPSTAPEITLGARRIIYKAARTGYDKIPLLRDHPDWPLAARVYRPFVLQRIPLPAKRILPDLP